MTAYILRVSTSNAKAERRYDKQDFVYKADEDFYLCPAGQRLTYRYSNDYWATARSACPLKEQCTTAKERSIKRWEHEAAFWRRPRSGWTKTQT